MKRLFLILILTFSFQSVAKTNDIRDFQIEGMSIGDSLLDYYNQKQINKFLKNDYGKNDFYKLEVSEQTLLNNLTTYDSVSFHVKNGDKKLRIYNIGGNIFFKKIKKCLKKKNEITEEISSIFNLKFQTRELTASFDKNTKYYQSEGSLGKSGVVAITCYDWSKDSEKKHGWTDNLSIDIYDQKLVEFIRNNS